MPKVLNVEKLEKKFASLTKSRESIQTLSSWIIHHKQFYKEITQEWLNALQRGDESNLITIFYVANDVIQHCRKKGAAEFREAFPTVLEKAVTLEKVKAMKDEVNRMIKIWYERGIFNEALTKRLQTSLNSSVVFFETTSDDSDELEESEIIATYKLEDLIECMRNLEELKVEKSAKEIALKNFEEPKMPNFDNLIVRLEGHEIARKFDTFQIVLEDYLNLANKVLAARKKALKLLKHSSVFFTEQNSEVKKVAHAYRIYGKKLTVMEKKLSEKVNKLCLMLPSPSLMFPTPSLMFPTPSLMFPSPKKGASPFQAECDLTYSSKSSVCGFSPALDENSSVSDSTPKIQQSPNKEIPRQFSAIASEGSTKETFFSPEHIDSVIKKEALLDMLQLVNSGNMKIMNATKSGETVDMLNNVDDDKTEIMNSAKSDETIDVPKIIKDDLSEIMNATKSDETIDVLKSVEGDLTEMMNAEKSDETLVPNNIKDDRTEMLNATKLDETIDVPKTVKDDVTEIVSAIKSEKTFDSPKIVKDEMMTSEKAEETINLPETVKGDVSEIVTLPESVETLPDPSKMDVPLVSEFSDTLEGYVSEVDFLLEEGYKNRTFSTKAAMKRKIDALFKLDEQRCKKATKRDICEAVSQQRGSPTEVTDLNTDSNQLKSDKHEDDNSELKQHNSPFQAATKMDVGMLLNDHLQEDTVSLSKKLSSLSRVDTEPILQNINLDKSSIENDSSSEIPKNSPPMKFVVNTTLDNLNINFDVLSKILENGQQNSLLCKNGGDALRVENFTTKFPNVDPNSEVKSQPSADVKNMCSVNEIPVIIEDILINKGNLPVESLSDVENKFKSHTEVNTAEIDSELDLPVKGNLAPVVLLPLDIPTPIMSEEDVLSSVSNVEGKNIGISEQTSASNFALYGNDSSKNSTSNILESLKMITDFLSKSKLSTTENESKTDVVDKNFLSSMPVMPLHSSLLCKNSDDPMSVEDFTPKFPNIDPNSEVKSHSSPDAENLCSVNEIPVSIGDISINKGTLPVKSLGAVENTFKLHTEVTTAEIDSEIDLLVKGNIAPVVLPPLDIPTPIMSEEDVLSSVSNVEEKYISISEQTSASNSALHGNDSSKNSTSNILEGLKMLTDCLSKSKLPNTGNGSKTSVADKKFLSSMPVMPLHSLLKLISCVLKTPSVNSKKNTFDCISKPEYSVTVDQNCNPSQSRSALPQANSSFSYCNSLILAEKSVYTSQTEPITEQSTKLLDIVKDSQDVNIITEARDSNMITDSDRNSNLEVMDMDVDDSND